MRQNRITSDITLLPILLKLLFWRFIAPSVIVKEDFLKIKHFSPLLRQGKYRSPSLAYNRSQNNYKYKRDKNPANIHIFSVSQKMKM